MLTSTVSATASTSPLLERKIVETSDGLQAAFARHLSSISENNAITIIEYIAAMKSEVNLSDNYRRDIIEVLCRFSRFNSNKNFKGLKRANIIAFLETFRRTETLECLLAVLPLMASLPLIQCLPGCSKDVNNPRFTYSLPIVSSNPI